MTASSRNESIRNHYEILGILQTASQDDIKKAYRKLARENHPDRGGDEAEFKKINEANQVLSDNHSKALYDAELSAGIHDTMPPFFTAPSRASSSSYGIDDFTYGHPTSNKDANCYFTLNVPFDYVTAGKLVSGVPQVDHHGFINDYISYYQDHNNTYERPSSFETHLIPSTYDDPRSATRNSNAFVFDTEKNLITKPLIISMGRRLTLNAKYNVAFNAANLCVYLKGPDNEWVKTNVGIIKVQSNAIFLTLHPQFQNNPKLLNMLNDHLSEVLLTTQNKLPVLIGYDAQQQYLETLDKNKLIEMARGEISLLQKERFSLNAKPRVAAIEDVIKNADKLTAVEMSTQLRDAYAFRRFGSGESSSIKRFTGTQLPNFQSASLQLTDESSARSSDSKAEESHRIGYKPGSSS